MSKAPASPSGGSPWLNLPNAISAGRVPLAAAFAVAEGATLRLAVVAVAAFSDWVDGVLARRGHRVTRVGELLDPVADRLFVVTAVVVLVLERQLPLASLPLLLVRDIGVTLGAAVVLLRYPRLRLAARPAGKRVTWLQLGALGALLLRPGLVWWIAPPIAVLGAYALFDYGRDVRRRLRG